MSQWPLITPESRRVGASHPRRKTLDAVLVCTCVQSYTSVLAADQVLVQCCGADGSQICHIWNLPPPLAPLAASPPHAASDIFSCNAPTDCTCTAICMSWSFERLDYFLGFSFDNLFWRTMKINSASKAELILISNLPCIRKHISII